MRVPLPLKLSALVALGMLTAPQALAQYPPSGPTAGVSDTTVQPGQDATVTGSNWLPDSFVDLDLFSSPVDLGRAKVDPQGTFSTIVTIPRDTTPGEHFIRISGTSDEGEPREVRIQVTVPGAGVVTGEVAFTGANITMWMLMAIALLVVGLIAAIIGRRRAGISG